MNKILFLIRGLPGSGKSTLGRIIWSEGVIFETDKYFIQENGEYKFDSSKLKEAHTWCKNQVEEAMKSNFKREDWYPEIVVSNTFTQEWEMKDYFDLAVKYGYKVISLIIENRHNGKNIHNVPEEIIDKMRKRFEIKL